ncbi:hypothetical protein FIBSPDRAFT_857623 [Athelia psychrophila]|uniref:BTB domain-containing protein n=1 Tax=Athelia psychrophila TaxID=1759441 RepID=A0A166MP47_9AGAM|nr:hypothetical protein FIBSPDRAFT_857623 [Fibularhizoctonia sp. CBS 109695]
MASAPYSTSPPSPSLMSLGSSRASSPFEFAVTEGPMDQANELDADKGKHPQYHFEDGNIIFLIGGTLYNVHRYFFARDSSHFRAILQDTDTYHPCVTLDVSCADFDEFLAILYPTDFRRPMKKTTAQWTSILHLAAKWGFANIKLLAIDNLTANATPIDKIVLGRRYSIVDWLPGAYEAVCTRVDPLTVEEGMKLGVEDTVRISATRQVYGIGKARYDAKYLADDLGEIFSLEKSEGFLAKGLMTVSAEGTESSLGTEIEEAAGTRGNIRAPVRSGSDSEVAGEAAVERTTETANHTTVIPTEHCVSHISSTPPSSPLVRGMFGNAGPLHSSTPTVSLVVDAVPAKVELSSTPTVLLVADVVPTKVELSSTPTVSLVADVVPAKVELSSTPTVLLVADVVPTKVELSSTPTVSLVVDAVPAKVELSSTPTVSLVADVVPAKVELSSTPTVSLVADVVPAKVELSSTPTVSLVVDAGPAKVELRTLVDQNSGIAPSSLVGAGRSVFHVPQSTPKILATHISPGSSSSSARALIDVNAATSNLLLPSASGKGPTPHLKPTLGYAAIYSQVRSSVLMVPAEGRL